MLSIPENETILSSEIICGTYDFPVLSRIKEL